MRVIIGAICALSLLSGNPWCVTSAIYKKYCSILSKELKPLSYRRIVDLLVEVENSGLVASRTLSRGRHGYGTEYKLKLSPDMVGPFISSSSKWWESVVEEKKKDELDELILDYKAKLMWEIIAFFRVLSEKCKDVKKIWFRPLENHYIVYIFST